MKPHRILDGNGVGVPISINKDVNVTIDNSQLGELRLLTAASNSTAVSVDGVSDNFSGTGVSFSAVSYSKYRIAGS